MAQKIKVQDGIIVYQSTDSANDIDFYINGYLHVSKNITADSFIGELSGNSESATILETSRNISATGDAQWEVSFDGSTDVSGTLTLASVNSSIQTDAFRRITVDGKGRITDTSPVVDTDITDTLGYTPVNLAGDTMAGYLILNAPPVNSLGAVTKQYVDDIASGLSIHAACVASTESNLVSVYDNGSGGENATLTGTGILPVIGGVTLSIGDRVLVKDQISQLENGIYVVTQTSSDWILTRAADFNGTPATEVQAGDATYIQQGTLSGTQWVQTTPGLITVGVSPIVFSQFGGPGTYTSGSGINITGTEISNTGVLSNIPGSGISISNSTGNVTIGNSGVITVAGTANQIISSSSTGNITLSLPTDVAISGTMSAGTFDGALLGNASTASKISTPRAISATGDATWSVNFDGSINVTSPLTLATVNSNIGTFNNLTVNSKGLVTSASNVAYLTGNQNITISGDASGSGTTSIGLTLATVNSNVGSFSYPTIVVNNKGLITSISSNTPVTSVSPGTGIGLSGSNGSVTISNNGVTSIAGTSNQVSLSSSTGGVTVSLPANVTISGTMTAGVFNSTSTKRVKKRIKTLGKSYLSKFTELKPREYDRKDYQAHEFGFIAEEMEKVYPEVVGKDENGLASGIDYGKLSTILTAKIQEQDETIRELQKQVNELISIVKGSK